MKTVVVLFLAMSFLSGCGGDDTKTEGGHVWKTQTDALESARQAGRSASNVAAERVKELEQNSP